jgi:hypothetical protein
MFGSVRQPLLIKCVCAKSYAEVLDRRVVTDDEDMCSSACVHESAHHSAKLFHAAFGNTNKTRVLG